MERSSKRSWVKGGRTIAVDWDGTLVDTKTQEWLPDAASSLYWMRGQGLKVIIHSSRARTAWGLSMIEKKLASAGLDWIKVYPKPLADFFIDNQAIKFEGDWREMLNAIAG